LKLAPSAARAPLPQRAAPVVGLALTLLLGGLTGACLGVGLGAGPHRVSPSLGPSAVSAAAPARRPPDPWAGSRRVPVRLVAAEGLATLTVEDQRGARIDLWRQGHEVARDGSEADLWQQLPPPSGTEGWRFRERFYPGELLVEPSPEGGLRLWTWVDLEQYVAGVVAAELVLWNAPPAVLEAQAIAARSYAVANLDRRLRSGRAFLLDSVLDQAYRGRFEPDQASRNRGLDQLLRAAVQRTAGRVLTVAGQVLDARFHAACGGHTAAFADVFGPPHEPAQESVPCRACSAEAAAEAARRASGEAGAQGDLVWSYTADPAALGSLARRFGIGETLRYLQSVERDPHGRWLVVSLAGDRGRREVPFVEVRQELGWGRVRSAQIRSTWPREGAAIQGGLRFEGLGSGHGVGLCQRGARGLADQGVAAAQILAHYYRGAQLSALDGLDRR
jgi:stage II sporulation protein D